MRKLPGVRIYNNPCEFTVWAPFADKMEVVLPEEKRTIELQPEPYGYWSAEVSGIKPNMRYLIRINGNDTYPDPASLSQPDGVHEASEVIDLSFDWTDENYNVPPLKDFILYELHVGTFTPEGTFDGVISKLDYLKDLGITAIELMPVNTFPGTRNWGYDGAYLYAVQSSYGGAKGLQRLVNAAHEKGIAVILDVVYNHFGPEGNYIESFGPFFTDKYKTPWGKAVNFDDAYSDEVRNFFIQNSLMWMRDFHIDGLRLDAIHAIKDFSAKHFLHELADATENFCLENNREHYLIAESDLNDTRIIKPASKGGYKIDAQWNDDFHHTIHAHVTGERDGYYQDFGGLEKLSKAYRKAFVFNGIYSPSRKQTYGNETTDHGGEQFVVFSQNHDQVGNRKDGDRLSANVSFECQKLIAGAVFVSPYIPLLFMGEEYGEENPFQYFVNHGDPDLIKAVQEGRKREFESFEWHGEVPDPQAEETFQRSVLSWKEGEPHQTMRKFYQKLIGLKKTHPVISSHLREHIETYTDDDLNILVMNRIIPAGEILVYLNFNREEVRHHIPAEKTSYHKILDSADNNWGGPGELAANEVHGAAEIYLQPESIVIYEKSQTT